MISPRLKRYSYVYADEELGNLFYGAELYTWPENSLAMAKLYRELRLYPTILAKSEE